MGMYADVYGGQVRMSGLLAAAVVEQASRVVSWATPRHRCHNFQGVALCEHDGEFYIEAGVVVLSRADVRLVVEEMRARLLNGWAKKCSISWDGQQRDALTNPQDILAYSQDVQAFKQLNCWLAYTDSDELVWA